ncbi:UDP-2,4-diacetamido-2,4,6-trideoxy-beta-L-altropyranose hydrolase [Clostridium uliginosum]|uniref:UDP-2,4-diacetamido-2,4,6-trideoxy-beta-L-altropyranose hydrolase n=1 Tax=Clostridium uliginosum TaxID=119641 RepID=A0A1I1RIE8_9CLOT|nr:UDP-2,4-diacetamido-2,4,6-trideoxy-beta-L-altropyranose hydrolase [Clostridium uliginosum]SFD34071.1 UDP-2,4-diacetamido-2,4,6-trideoxy-beta-L-altropyranose hydrolase [Clostridium uliginosum]
MLFIRTDANSKIGTGHLMRCLAIANQAKQEGVECIFIISDKETEQIITPFGFSTICLNSKWNNLNSEIAKLIQVINENKIKLLLVDSYYVTKEYFKEVGKRVDLIYLGDLEYCEEYIACLINYNNYYYKFNYENMFINKKTKLLLGTKYTPLRKEFININPILNNTVSNVLITTGGTDKYNIAEKLLQYFVNEKKETNINFNVVVGSLNKNLESLSEFEKKNKNVKLYININNIAQLMIESDIAISAGGSTLYELCACGTPTICYAFVNNQLDSINEFSNNEIMISVGDIRGREKECIDLIYDKIQFLKNNYHIRQKMSKSMCEVVDGKGNCRIIKEICALHH